jgi:dihydroceramidase
MIGGALALSFGLAVVLLAAFVGVPSAVPDSEVVTTATAAGYWGVPTAVHQFCEPKYATSKYVAEFYNSISSLLYVLVAAYALSRREFRQDPSMVLTAALVALIGLGSAAFHGTMLFEYEMCDEVPMLLFIAVALFNKMGVHAWLIRPASCAVFATAVVAATAALTYVYIKSGEYELFIAGFTFLVVVVTALSLSWRSSQHVTSFARNLSIGCIVLGKIVWEIEVRACATSERVWPLHVCWHVLSAASLYYGLLADLAARIDCGLTMACRSVEAVPISWAGVPYYEVRVVHARPERRQKVKAQNE